MSQQSKGVNPIAVRVATRRGDAELTLLRVETSFIADPSRRPVEYWWDRLGRKHLQLEDVKQRSHTEQWQARRQTFWRGAQAAILKQLEVRMVNDLSTELAEVQEMREIVARLLRPVVDEHGVERFKVQPRSYEGCARAYIQLDAAAEAKRESIYARMDPLIAASSDETKEGDTPFSRVEMRSMAHSLWRSRIAKRQQELMKDAEAEDDADERAEYDSEPQHRDAESG